jgi:hypothetical protein
MHWLRVPELQTALSNIWNLFIGKPVSWEHAEQQIQIEQAIAASHEGQKQCPLQRWPGRRI